MIPDVTGRTVCHLLFAIFWQPANTVQLHFHLVYWFWGLNLLGWERCHAPFFHTLQKVRAYKCLVKPEVVKLYNQYMLSMITDLLASEENYNIKQSYNYTGIATV